MVVTVEDCMCQNVNYSISTVTAYVEVVPVATATRFQESRYYSTGSTKAAILESGGLGRVAWAVGPCSNRVSKRFWKLFWVLLNIKYSTSPHEFHRRNFFSLIINNRFPKEQWEIGNAWNITRRGPSRHEVLRIAYARKVRSSKGWYRQGGKDHAFYSEDCDDLHNTVGMRKGDKESFHKNSQYVKSLRAVQCTRTMEYGM